MQQPGGAVARQADEREEVTPDECSRGVVLFYPPQERKALIEAEIRIVQEKKVRFHGSRPLSMAAGGSSFARREFLCGV